MSNAFDPFAPQPDRDDRPDEFLPTGPASEPSFEPLSGGEVGPTSPGEAYAQEPLGLPTYNSISPAADAPKPRGRSRFGLIIALVLLVAVGGGGGAAAWIYLNGNEERPVVKVDPSKQDPPKVEIPMVPDNSFETLMASLHTTPQENLKSLNADDANSEFGKVWERLSKGELSASDRSQLLTWVQKLSKEQLKPGTWADIQLIKEELSPGSTALPNEASTAPVPDSSQLQRANPGFSLFWPSMFTVATMQVAGGPAALDPQLRAAPMGLSSEEQEQWDSFSKRLQNSTATFRILAAYKLAEICQRKRQFVHANKLANWAIDLARSERIQDKEMRLLQLRIEIASDEQADQLAQQRLAFDEQKKQEEAKLLALMKQVEEAQTAQGLLRTDLSPVLGLVTDRAALNKQGKVIGERLGVLQTQGVPTARLEPLQQRFNSLEPELAAVTPLTAEQGVRLFAELQSLDVETTTLQLAVPSVVRPQVTFAKAGMIDLLKRLNLDETSLQGLNRKDMSSASHKLFTELEADLKAVQQRLQAAEMPARELTSQEYAEVTSKLSGIVYAANRLQAEKELATAATTPMAIPGSPRPGPGGPDPQVAALASRVRTLESAKPPVALSTKVTQNSTSITNLNAAVAQAKQEIEALKGKNIAVTLDQNQLDQLRRKVEEALKNNPTGVPPGLPVDSALAREYAAPAYHYYNDRNLVKAFQQFTLASQSDPYNPVYRYYLALILLEQGKHSDALQQARNGRQLESRYMSAQISVQLQKVQGPSRVWLEDVRMLTKLPGLGIARNP